MTEITWNELTADEREALEMMPVVFWQDSGYEDYQQHKMAILSLAQKGLVIHSMTRYSFTDAGRAVLAQKPAAKTVKLRVPSADGLYYETMYTDGTWEGEESK